MVSTTKIAIGVAVGLFIFLILFFIIISFIGISWFLEPSGVIKKGEPPQSYEKRQNDVAYIILDETSLDNWDADSEYDGIKANFIPKTKNDYATDGAGSIEGRVYSTIQNSDGVTVKKNLIGSANRSITWEDWKWADYSTNQKFLIGKPNVKIEYDIYKHNNEKLIVEVTFTNKERQKFSDQKVITVIDGGVYV